MLEISNKQLTQLATAVINAAQVRKQRIATAESCTGGWIAKVLTDVAGSSSVFDAGLVTYSNAAKQSLLQVKSTDLAQHGAVSTPVARAMALGALQVTGVDLTVAVTGIAGPGGGSAEKPVGLVCFAWAHAGQVWHEQQQFAGERDSVRRQTVLRALQGLLQALQA